MTFSLDKLWQDIANSTSLNSVFNNPIYTSFLIVFVVIFIIYIIFRTEINEEEYSFWTLMFRSCVYLLLPVMTILFIHYKNIERDFDNRIEKKKLTEAVMGSLEKNDIKNVSGAFEVDKPTLSTIVESNINKHIEKTMSEINKDVLNQTEVTNSIPDKPIPSDKPANNQTHSISNIKQTTK